MNQEANAKLSEASRLLYDLMLRVKDAAISCEDVGLDRMATRLRQIAFDTNYAKECVDTGLKEAMSSWLKQAEDGSKAVLDAALAGLGHKPTN